MDVRYLLALTVLAFEDQVDVHKTVIALFDHLRPDYERRCVPTVRANGARIAHVWQLLGGNELDAYRPILWNHHVKSQAGNVPDVASDGSGMPVNLLLLCSI